MFVFYALAKVPLSLVGTLMDSAYMSFEFRIPTSIPVKNTGPLLKAKNTNNNTKLAINSHYFFQRQSVNICIFSYKYHFLLAIRHETKNTF